jgi:RNA-directed DNA polymerase
VKAKVRAITGQTTNQPLAVVLHRLNWVLRGWANYFRHGATAKTFAYLDAFSWRRVMRWLCRKHLWAIRESRRLRASAIS